MRKKRAFVLILIGLLLLGLYLFFFNSLPPKGNTNQVTPTPTQTPEPTPTPTPTPITYDTASPDSYTHFFELQPVLGGQQGYAAIPKEIPYNEFPSIVIYYHGSTQKITTNFSEEVMKNMRSYGAYFTERNTIFLASNQHGDNWGSAAAVADSEALIAWVKERYPTNDSLYVLGFSMGGMPALKHVLTYPKKITKIALLAPANQVEYYSPAQIQLFKTIPLEIWHGTKDVNVPYWATELLVKEFKKQNTPVIVHTLEGKTHWDVDTEYMKDVYEYFIR